MNDDPRLPPSAAGLNPGSDRPFFIGLGLLGGSYIVLIVAMLAADVSFTAPTYLLSALATPELQYATMLSLVSCSISALLAIWMAVPLGYLLARTRFPGRSIIEALVDVPIVLPPLVIGLSLLILFQTLPGRLIERIIPVSFAVPGVIVAQTAVATAFAVRIMSITFAQISPRTEQVALTLGCHRSQAFWLITMPEARRGILTAAMLAWARSLGEFGPILIFAGATPMRTEVLPTSIFLELSVGKLEAALAVSLLMVILAAAVLVLTRFFGLSDLRLVDRAPQ